MFINSIKYLVSLLISIYLFTVISKEIYINFNELLIIKEELFLVILVIILFVPIFYLLTIKLQYLINHLKNITFLKSFNATLIAYSYNLILPAKAGDFFRYKHLDLNINFRNFFSINIIEKLISLSVLILLILLSLLFGTMDIKSVSNIKIVYVYVVSSILVFGLFYIICKFGKKKNYNFFKIINLYFFDFTIWIFQFIQIFIIMIILDINIGFFDSIFIFGLSILVGLLPISIGGFGVRDYIILILFQNLNMDVNMFMVLFLFNLRYLLPIFVSFIFSIFKIYNFKKKKL